MDSSVGSQYNSCYLTGVDMDNGSFNRSGSFNLSYSGMKQRGNVSTSNHPDANFAGGNQGYSSVQVRGNEKIESWFYGILASRQFVANKALLMFTIMTLLAASLFIRLSIWTPLESVVGEFKMLINWKFYLMVIVTAGLFGFGFGYYAFSYIFSPYNENVSSIDKPGFWKAMWSFTGAYLLGVSMLPFIVDYSPSWTANAATLWLVFLATVVTSTRIALDNSFRYNFNANIKYGQGWIALLKCCINAIIDGAPKTLMKIVFSLQYTYLIAFVTSLFVGFLRSHVHYLFDPMLLIHNAVLIGCFYVLADLVCLSSTAVVTEGIEFPMPTPFFFSDARVTIVNLINGMNSSDLFLRQFAFYDFKNKTEGQQKGAFFTLSQPGNHPRLWNALVAQCLSVIDQVSKVYFKETEASMAKNFVPGTRMAQSLTGNKNKSDKSSMMLPPSLKPRQHTTQKQLSLINLEPLKVVVKPYIDKVYSVFFAPKHFVSTAETELAMNAVVGLANLIECSYKLDKYGIAQKSLSPVVASFIQLAAACDQLIRAKFMRLSSATDIELRVFETKNTVVATLIDIYTAFESHISELNLSADQLALLKEYVDKI